ncbi:uncharacterized protein LOC116618478 [Nematostella vectensis]|uniref:uncharacterized protein LOC116618478 n=1 Tax=Nematostella vectensis TaxID=45351 RepID=UPI00138FD9C2|nr:uncharacterized protein LOC116618478 [Nematostella vectensis]
MATTGQASKENLESFASRKNELDTRIISSQQATLQATGNTTVEKALSMNSLTTQTTNARSHYNSSQTYSTELTSGNPQTSQPQRPRSAPHENNPGGPRGSTGSASGEVPRRMAICEANDDAEQARRRMRIYQKRF